MFKDRERDSVRIKQEMKRGRPDNNALDNGEEELTVTEERSAKRQRTGPRDDSEVVYLT